MRPIVGPVVVACVLFAGCTFEEGIRRAPVSVDASTSSSGSGGAGGAPVSGPVKRTVSMRSPMGAPVGNLLIDGDFEFAITIEGHGTQAGWLAVSSSGNGQRYLRGETGGLCRSGLRCGVLAPDTLLFGRGAAANGTGMLASLWAKPPEGKPCEVIRPALVNCNFSGFATALVAASEQPRADGWCVYEAAASQQDRAACMIIESDLTTGETALVDAAAIVPDDGTVPLRSMQPVGGAQFERYQRVSKYVRDRMPFGKATPRPEIGQK